MRKLLGLGVVAAVGTAAYWHSTRDEDTTNGAGTTGGGEPAASPSIPDQVAALAGRRDGLTHDQWNYYMQLVTGRPGPAIEDARGVVRGSGEENYLLTLDEWWKGVELVSMRGTLGRLVVMGRR